MSYRMNLDLSPKTITRNGIQVFFNWTDSDDGRNTEPALIFRQAGRGRSLYVLPMSYLHRVVESSGFAGLGLVSLAAEIAQAIGFARLDKCAARAVADMILDETDTLLRMPGEPPVLAQAGTMAEITLKVDGETVIETEIAA